MTQIIVGENEHLESALRRFKREVSLIGDFSRHEKAPSL